MGRRWRGWRHSDPFHLVGTCTQRPTPSIRHRRRRPKRPRPTPSAGASGAWRPPLRHLDDSTVIVITTVRLPLQLQLIRLHLVQLLSLVVSHGGSSSRSGRDCWCRIGEMPLAAALVVANVMRRRHRPAPSSQ